LSIFFINSNQTSTRALAVSDGAMVTRNGGISVPGGNAIEALGTANGTTVQVGGYLYGRYAGIRLTGTSIADDDPLGLGGHVVQVTANGVVGGAENVSDYAAIMVSGTGNRIYNEGQVFGGYTGILAHGSDTAISNGGTVMGSARGIEFRGGDGLSFYYTLTNSGTVEGETGIARTGGFGETRINNTGEIVAGSAGWAIAITGTAAGASSLVLVNAGTVSGGIQAAVAELDGTPDQTDDTILNHGLIAGNAYLSLGADSLRNDGRIDGDVDLGVGDDIYSGFGGTVSGAVLGGDGNDLFLVDQPDLLVVGGAGNDTLRGYSDVTAGGGIEVIQLLGGAPLNATGDDGANTITGNSGANILEGGDGADTLIGFAGTDDLSGGAGNDVLRAGVDADFLSGGADNDVLAGQGGNDELEGGTGDDTMAGHAGDDVLTGGLGRDLLVGGIGADVYIFTDIAESSGDLLVSDRIAGFVSGEDRVDLSEINEEAFAFLGTDVFTGGGGMELRYLVNAVGHAIVYLDADGDGGTDAALIMLGAGALSATDFIL